MPALHEILIAAGEACSNALEHSGAEPGAGSSPSLTSSRALATTSR